ncbi:hypothetical protein [Dactylosporangium sp. NPDC005555]|uniref:hypothetical protein n=1 Tax=Dactylosporangium sp. NPDC005555 TaxID=3154889 RepID=UPI0033B71E54
MALRADAAAGPTLRDPGPDDLRQALLSDIQDVVKGVTGFLTGDPAILSRFAWRPYAL